MPMFPLWLEAKAVRPDTHDYFDISLGTCKAITVQMYAKRKKWPLPRLLSRCSGTTVRRRMELIN